MRPTWLNSIEEIKLGRALGMVNYVFRKKDGLYGLNKIIS